MNEIIETVLVATIDGVEIYGTGMIVASKNQCNITGTIIAGGKLQ